MDLQFLSMRLSTVALFFFFNDTATTEIYTLSLHDALPICIQHSVGCCSLWRVSGLAGLIASRSEEHTSELQSPYDIVCRLLLEKKKKTSGQLVMSINIIGTIRAITSHHNK